MGRAERKTIIYDITFSSRSFSEDFDKYLMTHKIRTAARQRKRVDIHELQSAAIFMRKTAPADMTI